MKGNVFNDRFGDFRRTNFYTPSHTVDFLHIPTQNKHRKFWPRSCRVYQKFGSWIPDIPLFLKKNLQNGNNTDSKYTLTFD